jgi:DNA anti-recombination protein RmuC
MSNVEAVVPSSGVTGTISVDEFQALEQKVLRAVEIVRREREARIAAEAEAAAAKEEAAALREQLADLTSASNAAQTQITTLNQERDAVRLRVEKMLQQMDELV